MENGHARVRVGRINRREAQAAVAGHLSTFCRRRLLETGERLRLEGFEAEILEAKDGRATRVRVTLESAESQAPE